MFACLIVLCGFALFFSGQRDAYPHVSADFYYENVSGYLHPMTAQVPRMEDSAKGPEKTSLWIADWQAPPLPLDLLVSPDAGSSEGRAGGQEWWPALTAGLLSISAGFGFLSIFCDRPWWL
ncbi:hypothetical protein [Labrenzia sp. VG12]|uniref:hypothetical protein n=1 Tax=Labrenzia sp. VG12 TaxID=2021862 RepID=UPI0012FD44E0|nr:hypothetical protein [Labrenzia sp. VG12]